MKSPRNRKSKIRETLYKLNLKYGFVDTKSSVSLRSSSCFVAWFSMCFGNILYKFIYFIYWCLTIIDLCRPFVQELIFNLEILAIHHFGDMVINMVAV